MRVGLLTPRSGTAVRHFHSSEVKFGLQHYVHKFKDKLLEGEEIELRLAHFWAIGSLQLAIGQTFIE